MSIQLTDEEAKFVAGELDSLSLILAAVSATMPETTKDDKKAKDALVARLRLARATGKKIQARLALGQTNGIL